MKRRGRLIRLLPAVERDIELALLATLRRFGVRKYDEYRALIRQAIRDIQADPDGPQSKRRSEIHRSARTFHIARRGRRARHFLLYRISEDGVVEFARLLYDGMDLEQHLPAGYGSGDPATD
jgi:toxin ParE1/3/4